MTYNDLAPDREQVNRLARQAVGGTLSRIRSPNTVNAYCSAMRYWFAWYQSRFGGEMTFPVSEQAVVQFVADHAALSAPMRRALAAAAREGPLPAHIDELLVDAGFKAEPGPFTLGTLDARLAALSSVHRWRDLKDPCKHLQVRELIANVRRHYTKPGVGPDHGLTAFTLETFNAVLATCDGSPRGRRDRAMLLFAWEGGGRRRSEVASATLENLRRVGPQHYLYFLPKSNAPSQTAGKKPLTGDAAIALDAWLEIRGLAEGSLFQSIRKNGRCSNEGLEPDSIRRIVKNRCRQAGLPNEYSSLSLRFGFVADAGRRHIGLAATMQLSGHKALVTAARHYYPSEYNLGPGFPDLMADADTTERSVIPPPGPRNRP